MNENTDNIREAIHAAIIYHNEHLQEVSEYPPIFNSLVMLSQLIENLDRKSYLLLNLSLLNVGLLAAKSLDFEEKDSALYQYATQLHNIWFNVLNYLQISTSTPKKGDRLKAYNFYNKHGYDPNRIINHLSCIDFTYPIQIMTLTKNFIVGQWRVPTISQGDYYSLTNKYITPSCLGINDHQEDKMGNIYRRRKYKYQLQIYVEVLQSTARGVLDTWSVKSSPIQTHGGCIQYFNSNNKNDFINFP